MKPLHLMTRKELEQEATRIIEAAEPKARVHEDKGVDLVSWQLTPVALEWRDHDAYEISSTFAELSGAWLAAHFETSAWRQVAVKAAYNRKVREQEPKRAQRWRENERAARKDPVRGERIKARERMAKRRKRHAVKACRELFEGCLYVVVSNTRGRMREKRTAAPSPAQLALFSEAA